MLAKCGCLRMLYTCADMFLDNQKKHRNLGYESHGRDIHVGQ